MTLDLGVDIIHCAYCLPSLSSTVSDLLRSTLEKAERAGVLVVAPSGNNSGECLCAPADQTTVLAVGALDADNQPRLRSNDGVAYQGHGVMTLGTDVDIAVSPSETEQQDGTSCAAPIATAVSALLLGLSRASAVGLRATDIGRVLLETAQMPTADGAGTGWIGGILDAGAAQSAILGSSAIASGVDGADQSTISEASPTIMFPSRLFALGALDVQAADDAAYERLSTLLENGADPDDSVSILDLLNRDRSAWDLVHWILRIEDRPIWIIRGAGAFAGSVPDRLLLIARTALELQSGAAPIDHVSLPGIATTETVALRRGGSARVAYCTTPESINAWNDRELVTSILTGVLGSEPSGEQIAALLGVVRWINGEMTNDGTLGRDRALNQIVTNLYQLAVITLQAMDEGREFAGLRIQKSRFDRPSSDCWDILVEHRDRVRSTRASRQWVWTIDVAGERPVSVGSARSWFLPG